MAEILQHPFEDPDEETLDLGVESSEIGSGSRAAFDDVDDYDDWSASPPQESDGMEIPWATTYARKVKVQWVDPGNLAATSVTPTGVKRMKVSVEHADQVLVVLQAFRTNQWRAPWDQ